MFWYDSLVVDVTGPRQRGAAVGQAEQQLTRTSAVLLTSVVNCCGDVISSGAAIGQKDGQTAARRGDGARAVVRRPSSGVGRWPGW